MNTVWGSTEKQHDSYQVRELLLIWLPIILFIYCNCVQVHVSHDSVAVHTRVVYTARVECTLTNLGLAERNSYEFCVSHFIILIPPPCIDDEAVNGGFHLEALNGSNPNNDSHCTSNFNTIIILGCNKDAQWPESGDLTNHIVPIYDERCQVIFSPMPHYVCNVC